MAINISNTAHYKKGEKLPDGSIAKRGVVINKTTGKRVTGKVTMAAAGQGGMGATKSYKAGRSVAAMKKSASKPSASKPAIKTRGGGTGASGDTGPSAAKKARDARLQQNKGVKGGTVRVGAAGRSVRKYNAKTGRWDRVATSTGTSSRSATSATVSSATTAAKPRTASRSATSATVSSAIAAGNAKGQQFSRRSPLSVKGIGERVGIGANMTRREAMQILSQANKGRGIFSDTLLKVARKVVEGK